MKLDSHELAAIHAAATRMDIPHSQLRLSETYQARSAGDRQQDPEIVELKATIQAMGVLLQNLVVVEAPDGFYEVCAGGRRWTALGLLIEDGAFPADYPTPCLVIPAAHAHHASLIENVARRAMHPADVFASYARLRIDGWTVDAIAAAHGANEKAVKKLLALGEVSPTLMDLFRQGKIALDEMYALAAVSDHTRQEAAWKAAKQGYHHRPTRIRQLLAEAELRGDSKVARYVTVAAYEKAGGGVRRDLFEDNTYLDDPERVRSMALQKMQRSKLARTVGGEGWGWVDYRVDLDYSERQKLFGEIQRVYQEPSKAQAKQIDGLQKKLVAAQAKLAALQEAEGTDAAELDEVRGLIRSYDVQIREIKAELLDYPADLKALSGAVLHLDNSGNLTVTRGLIRQEDRDAVAEKVRSADKTSANAAVDLPPVKTRPVHSEALTNRLQAQRVIALQYEVMVRPNLALCLLVEQMLGDWDRARRCASGATFDISTSTAQHDLANTDPNIKECSAWLAVQDMIETVTMDVPKDESAILPWLLTQSQADVLDMLAVLTSQTICRRPGHGYGSEAKHLDRLSSLVSMDMSRWWKPTQQSYLAHVSKDQITAVVTQAVGAEQAKSLSAMKKAEAATAAEQLLHSSSWVPELMRTEPLAVAMAVEHPIGDMEE